MIRCGGDYVRQLSTLDSILFSVLLSTTTPACNQSQNWPSLSVCLSLSPGSTRAVKVPPPAEVQHCLSALVHIQQQVISSRPLHKRVPPAQCTPPPVHPLYIGQLQSHLRTFVRLSYTQDLCCIMLTRKETTQYSFLGSCITHHHVRKNTA